MTLKNKTKRPSKQRSTLVQSSAHRRSKMLSANLSSNLRTSYGRRSVPVRKGDTVKVSRGDHKGFEGKIIRVDREKYRLFIDGIKREKADGTSILVPIHSS